MTSKLTITRERLEALAVEDDLYNYPPTQDELNTLARMALASMDSEPVAVVDIQRGRGDGRKYALCYTSAGHSLPDDVYNLYVVRQPAPERDRVRCEHAEWSQATFGNVGPVGPLKHLSKEALEAAAEPDDLSEWADMQFLLWDAQRRAGITDEQIIQAMIEKLAVNKLREWPEPKDGEPRLHIKEQLAPLVPTFEEWCKRTGQKPQGWVRDAMKEAYDGAAVAMLQAGNSPVIPDGYVMVPKEPTERMVIDGFESEPDETFSEPDVWEAYQKMSGCQQAAYRARLCWAAMLAAAPQEVK